MNQKLRLLLMLAALPLIGLFLVQQVQQLLQNPKILPIDDFVEYWAAGRLNASGEDPYDPSNLLRLERLAGRDTDEAVMMWNPPWTLSLAMPFGSMDSRPAQLLWIGLGLLFIVAGADLLWRIFDGPAHLRWVSWSLAFTFMPTFFVLNAGQIGTWVLAGVVLFLYFQKHAWSALAGAATVLLAIKPHLVYLFWIALIVWGFRRDRRLILAGLLTGIAATVIPLCFNPHVLHQYWVAMTQRPPAQWQSLTIGTLIRMVEGESRFGLTFVPILLGLAWLLWHSLRSSRKSDVENVGSTRRSGYDWVRNMPILMLVSFVTAPYGAWPFDLVILLPAVVQAAVWIARANNRSLIYWSIGCWLLINLSALALNLAMNVSALQPKGVQITSFWFIWMAPAILLGYFLIMHRCSPHAPREKCKSAGDSAPSPPLRGRGLG